MFPALGSFLLAFLGAFLAAFLCTVPARRLALWLGAVDHPGGRRVHRSPTARLGGLGIAAGFAFAVALLFGLDHLPGEAGAVAGILSAAAVALAVGMVDDVRGLGALPKVAGQVGAGLLLWAGGLSAEEIGIPGLGAVAVGAWSLPLTLAWVVGVTNAINLIDGLDGLAGGLALVAALAAAALLAIAGDPAWLLAAALAGAVAGFLWFNLPPALIFMGDSGSLLVGVLLAALGLRLVGAGPAGVFPLVPSLLLAVPLFDMAWAIARRGRRGDGAGYWSWPAATAAMRRIVQSDGGHLHHRLLHAGWSPRSAAGLLWRVATACATLGIALAHAPVLAVALGVPLAAWLARVSARMRFRLGRGAVRAARVRSLVPVTTEFVGPPVSVDSEEVAA